MTTRRKASKDPKDPTRIGDRQTRFIMGDDIGEAKGKQKEPDDLSAKETEYEGRRNKAYMLAEKNKRGYEKNKLLSPEANDSL